MKDHFFLAVCFSAHGSFISLSVCSVSDIIACWLAIMHKDGSQVLVVGENLFFDYFILHVFFLCY